MTSLTNPFLNDNDDEETVLRNVQQKTRTVKTYQDDVIKKTLEHAFNENKRKYPAGGLKSSRFLTTDLLMKLPYSYFQNLEESVKKAVDYAQTQIVGNNSSAIISEAKNNPTDDSIQEKAWSLVDNLIAEYMSNHEVLTPINRSVVRSLAVNDIIGFSVLDPLWRDNRVTEILVNGPKSVEVEIGGTLYSVPGCKFRDRDHLTSLIDRLYGAIDKQVSRTTPIVDGRLHDFSRLAVVHDSVAPEGPNFSIRRHREGYIPPSRLIRWGSVTEDAMAFLGNLIYKEASILVVGGTGSGKTTLLGALTGFIRNDHRIITLEDNLELKLPNHKMRAAPMECKDPRPDMPGSGTDMRKLVKSSLRLRPDAIIIGEVRDEAAYDLCQALNTGHYGMSTIHANSDQDAIHRLQALVSQTGQVTPDGALAFIASSFDFIVVVERIAVDGSRKITTISEVSKNTEKNSAGEVYLPTRKLWGFVNDGIDPNTNKVLGHWQKFGDVSSERRAQLNLDLEKDKTWEELQKIAKDF